MERVLKMVDLDERVVCHGRRCNPPQAALPPPEERAASLELVAVTASRGGAVGGLPVDNLTQTSQAIQTLGSCG